jgi:hypothetical protein
MHHGYLGRSLEPQSILVFIKTVSRDGFARYSTGSGEFIFVKRTTGLFREVWKSTIAPRIAVQGIFIRWIHGPSHEIAVQWIPFLGFQMT